MQVLDEAAAFKWFAQQIVKNPLRVAQITGIQQIGYLKDLKPAMPSPTLTEVGDLYQVHAKLSPNWRSKTKGFWTEFMDVVEATTVRELTQEQVVEYADVVKGAAQSPAYVRQRFGAIKAILNFPSKRAKWTQDCNRALATAKALVLPKQSAADPNPIEPDHFHDLLEAADAEMKAMLLLMLNACIYGGEVAVLNWSELDLVKGTLVTVTWAAAPKPMLPLM